MKIRMNPRRKLLGAIAFWVAAFVVVVAVIVLTIIIMKVMKAVRHIETIRPKWDDVGIELYNEALQIAAENGGDTNLVRYFWEVDIRPTGYGLIVQSTSTERPPTAALSAMVASSGSGWRTNNDSGQSLSYITVDASELDGWMPQPDPSVPFMFYHKMFVRTNFDEEVTVAGPPPLNQ